MTRVAILWHMHQPFYEDLVTHEHILPWVRLHALKDYYGMVALLREFPDVRITFNLVPSLLVQLEAFATDQAHDRFLALSLKPADDLTDADVVFMLENFFHAQRQRMIEAYPRYAQLLAHRGAVGSPADAHAAARRFSREDLRDLQVWHKLAWIDPFYLEGDTRVRELVVKERGFTEDDKAVLREVELEILNKIIPEYRHAAADGRVELSASPFYHPILPLLCDTDIYLRTHPDSRRPRHRFVHPEDAAEQLARAVALHRRLFGRAPVGLWPSEGSVSDEMAPLAAAAGFTWMATDELILARTLGVTLRRDGHGHLDQPELMYAPYTLQIGRSRISCAFRDHLLSDLIGFTYAGWPADAAAQDFVGRLVEAGRRYSERTSGEEATIAIILDGENAWEHFEGGGRPFLRALYRRLSTTPGLRTVTMAEACAHPRKELTGIFPGSWIDANFYIWIGHADDQRAWGQLAEARRALDRATDADADSLARAREEVLIAEGSDWCWWYGDDHSSAHDIEFDELFRRHLRNVYKLLGMPVPDELFVTNISTGAVVAAEEASPSAFFTPTLDGEETSYFEWLGAGAVDVRGAVGAMHRTDGRTSLVDVLFFGFDRQRFYVRVDGVRRMADVLADGFEISLTFLRPEGVRYVIRHEAGELTGTFFDRDGPDGQVWIDRGAGGSTVAAGTVIEVALPLHELEETAGAALAFFVAVYDGAHNEIERHPSQQPVQLTIPDERFEARNWTA
ncbi:MAG: glycoside hydrolase [Acidobacteriota bacterium]